MEKERSKTEVMHEAIDKLLSFRRLMNSIAPHIDMRHHRELDSIERDLFYELGWDYHNLLGRTAPEASDEPTNR